MYKSFSKALNHPDITFIVSCSILIVKASMDFFREKNVLLFRQENLTKKMLK